MHTYLWSRNQIPKPAKSIVKSLLRYHRIQITDKKLGSDLYCFLLVGRCLVHSNRLAVESDLVHDPGRIFGVFLTNELDEPIALMCLRHTILWQMHVDYATGL